VLASFGLLVGTQLANWVTGFRQVVHSMGVHPFAALLLLLGVLWMEWRWFRQVQATARVASCTSSARTV
jgi:hypothetical protein